MENHTLIEVAQRHLDGTATQEELSQLSEALATDPAAREAYLSFCHHEEILHTFFEQLRPALRRGAVIASGAAAAILCFFGWHLTEESVPHRVLESATAPIGSPFVYPFEGFPFLEPEEEFPRTHNDRPADLTLDAQSEHTRFVVHLLAYEQSRQWHEVRLELDGEPLDPDQPNL